MSPSSAELAVALYVGLNGLILLWLGTNAGLVRRRLGVSMGDGGDARLLRAMRGQANFAEYVPLCLVELAAMAVLGTPVWVLHLFGLALTLGRAVHAWHFVQADAPEWQRAAGAALTLAVLGLGSFGLIAHALVRMV
jgi:uncharacterized membrane protein YecN with MAPEG domain